MKQAAPLSTLVLACLVGCGRMGFERRIGADASETGDAAVSPTADAFDRWDAATGCQQAAPFLFWIDTHEYQQASQLETLWCSAGITGPVTASLIIETSLVVRDQQTVPIEDGRAQFYIGSSGCACFTRLEAGGVTIDSPVQMFSGD